MFTNLGELLDRFRKAGATRIYGKELSPNDNSKNQIYLGGSLQALHLLPVKEITPDPKNSNRLKAPLNFSWLSSAGLNRAPTAQIIMYPEYPEVRLSGFLLRTTNAPSELMTSRLPGRVLLFGICADDRILAVALAPEEPAALEFIGRCDEFTAHGVLRELARPSGGGDDSVAALMMRLSEIHHKSWIHAWQLGAGGKRKPCNSPQCGGYTLEAELGIQSNGRCEPDFMGWELKSYDSEAGGSKPITLITPEPTGGLYHDDFEAFWLRYSYADKTGREGRRNFGGVYRCGAPAHKTTALRLEVSGFSPSTGNFEGSGTLALLDPRQRVAASWTFITLLDRWSRKHARVAYVPVEKHSSEPRRYRYGSTVSLGQGTDFVRFLKAVSTGDVYLDPALKHEDGKFKKRSQFRVARKKLKILYTQFLDSVDVDDWRRSVV